MANQFRCTFCNMSWRNTVHLDKTRPDYHIYVEPVEVESEVSDYDAGFKDGAASRDEEVEALRASVARLKELARSAEEFCRRVPYSISRHWQTRSDEPEILTPSETPGKVVKG